MDPGSAAIGAAITAILVTIFREAGGLAVDWFKLRRARIQTKIAEEQAKTQQPPS